TAPRSTTTSTTTTTTTSSTTTTSGQATTTTPPTTTTTTSTSTTTTTHAGTTSTTTSTTVPRTTTTTTLPTTALGLVMIANPDPVAPAGLVAYELTATNLGPVDAVQAVLHMTLPNGVFACGTPSDGGQLPTGCGPARDVA